MLYQISILLFCFENGLMPIVIYLILFYFSMFFINLFIFFSLFAFIVYFFFMWKYSTMMTVYCDVAVPYQFLFQDPATEFVEGIIDLHHDVMGYLVFICFFVGYMLTHTVILFEASVNKQPPVDVRHNTLIEVIWTIIPTVIIMAIAIPSFVLIYAMDEIVNPKLTVKAVGSQWYWNYEYRDMVSYFAPLKRHVSAFDLFSTTPFLFQKSFFNLFNFTYSLWTSDYLQKLLYLIPFGSKRTKFSLKLLYIFECSLIFPYSVKKNFSFYDFLSLKDCRFYAPFYFFPRSYFYYHFISKNIFRVFDYYFGSFAANQVKNYVFNFVDVLGTYYIPKAKLLILEPKFAFYSICEQKAMPALYFFYLKLFTSSFSKSFVQLSSYVFKPLKILAFEKYSDSMWFKNFWLFSINHIIFDSQFFLYSFFDAMLGKELNLCMYKIDNFLITLFNLKRVEYSYLNFESRMLDTDLVHSSAGKKFRLLSVDNPCILPSKTQIRLLTTATDVLHSWTVPSFGVKIDACPGRLNQVGLYIKRSGLFYGQCSEICGINHGFMPIEVRVISWNSFSKWINNIFSPTSKFF